MMRSTINIRGKIYSFDTPKVMGIVNLTPDSFYSGSCTPDSISIKKRINRVIQEGVDILDFGGCSTRPGASEISAEEEYERLLPALEVAKEIAPEIPVSIDTFRSSVARKCVEEWEADIINDISGGTLDPEMWPAVAELNVPYVLMHMRGTPADMQQHTSYEDVVADVLKDLAFKIADLRQIGVADVIVDPGFGFAKTTDQNFKLLKNLEVFKQLGCPILAGISRKSMIWKTLGSTPEEALNGTTVLNTVALMKGADIIRVHDVKQAKECVALTTFLKDKRDV
ncbi:MAG: dihydropteroate synthase [Muribaculaceae bacterium]|nr:dihydropteroate synthase [Muribaculaceae bacterium]